MAQRKKSWAQVKATITRKHGAPGSGFNKIQDQNDHFMNNTVALAQREQLERKELEDEDLEVKKKRVRKAKATAKEATPAVEKEKEPKDAIPAIKKKGTGRRLKRLQRCKRKDSIVDSDDEGEQDTNRSKRKRAPLQDEVSDEGEPAPNSKRLRRGVRRITDDAEEDDPTPKPVTECWRPYHGQSEDEPGVPTKYLGIARVAEFRLDEFKKALRERLLEYGRHVYVPSIETERLDEGGETYVDVGARFLEESIAEQIQVDLDGEVLMGRKLQIKFADE